MEEKRESTKRVRTTEVINDKETAGGAAPAAVPVLTSWDVLPSQVLVAVLSRLPCHAERVHMSCVNKHWSRVFKEHSSRLPRQLPWLVLPSTTQPLFHDTLGRETCSLRLPPDVKERGLFCGSFEGGWFVLALDQPLAHQLFNINTGRRIELPSTILMDEIVLPVSVEAAVLSGPPVPPYTVGAIVTVGENDYWSIAYWEPSMQHWRHVVSPRDEDNHPLGIQDVICHRGAFYFITSDENLQLLIPDVNQDSNVSFMSACKLQVKERRDYWGDVHLMKDDKHEKGYIMRYLVESRDGNELLMVIKYHYLCIPTIPTWLIRVFRLQVEASDSGDSDDNSDSDDDQPRASWVNLRFQLPGRMVFVGRACSRSFEAADFPTFQEHPKVFFLDDRCIEATEEGYLRDDMGKFSLRDLGVEVRPPAGGKQILPLSDTSPPTWWLH